MNYDEMIISIGKGDMDALECLYNALYTDVFAYLCSIIQDSAVSADIAQDTFVKIYDSAGKFHPRGYGKAWVMKIAKNLALNEIKRRKREHEEFPTQAYSEDGEMLYIKQSLAELKTSEREIVMLKAYGYSHKEISNILEIPAGTVRWKYSAAIKKMKVELAY